EIEGRTGGVMMRKRLLEGASAGVALAVLALAAATVAGQSQTTARTGGPALKTAWGEPDLQGIWSDEYQIPLERPAQYGNKEFFTDAERAELDKLLAGSDHFGDRTQPRGTEADVGGAYNSVFTSQR